MPQNIRFNYTSQEIPLAGRWFSPVEYLPCMFCVIENIADRGNVGGRGFESHPVHILSISVYGTFIRGGTSPQHIEIMK
jgi:hypothetical protein